MNLIIDGHAYLNVISPVALHILRNNASEEEIFDTYGELTPEAKEFFKGFFIRFLGNIITPYNRFLNHVYIVLDKDSWRKYYTKKFCNRNPNIAEYEYKGNRKKSKEKKSNIFKLFDFFIKEIAPELVTLQGVTVLSVRGAEGDDLIAFLSNKLDGHVVIWSGDTDLCQLLTVGDNVTFMVTPKRQGKNPIKKVYIPIYEDKGINLTNNMMDFNNVITFFNTHKDYMVEESDFNIELLVKIIGGDRGDNIQSLYHYLSDTGRRMNISEAQARSIVSSLLAKYQSHDILKLLDESNEEFFKDIVDISFEKKNLKKKNDERNLKSEILTNLKFNIKMIRLSEATIPAILLETAEHKLNLVKNPHKFNFMDFMGFVKLAENTI